MAMSLVLKISVLCCVATSVCCLSNEEILKIIEKQQAEIDLIKTENLGLARKVNALENDVLGLKRDNKRLKSELRSCCEADNSIDTGAKEVHSDILDKRPSTKKETKADHRRLLMSSVTASTHRPAFTARLSSHVNNLGHQQPLLFDNVLTNIGNSYNKFTGAFTAPVNGTYFFFASILSQNGQYVQMEIVKNGAGQVYMYVNDSNQEQGTNAVVLSLNEGDTVWVRHLGNEGSKVNGDNWSTFSGFQLF